MGLPQRIAPLTPAEYLAIERAASFRSEYYRGEIFAMAGGSPRHSLIKTNITRELSSRLRGKPCVTYDSDLRYRCPTGLYTYPDVSVICAKAEFDDENRDTVLNPTLLVEVLSKSTEGWDRGKKFDHYLTIRSLRELVYVSQDSPHVRKFFRNPDESWTFTVISGTDQILTLVSLGVELPLAEIFERVEFQSEESQDENSTSEISLGC